MLQMVQYVALLKPIMVPEEMEEMAVMAVMAEREVLVTNESIGLGQPCPVALKAEPAARVATEEMLETVAMDMCWEQLVK